MLHVKNEWCKENLLSIALLLSPIKWLLLAVEDDTIKFASFYTIKIYQKAGIQNLLIQRDQKNRIPKNGFFRKKKHDCIYHIFVKKFYTPYFKSKQ